MAGGIALLAAAVGKFASVAIAVEAARNEPADVTKELAISFLADDVVDERLTSGVEVNWPGGQPGEELDSEDDYPADVWKDAESRWNALGPVGQTDYRAELETRMRE